MDIEDHQALVRYLRETGRLPEGESPRVRTLSGGVSNRVVLLEQSSGEAWVLKQALAKLRVPVDWFSDPGRIHREAEAMRWLKRLAPAGAIPNLIFEDAAHHLLAMEAVPQPHQNWKTMLLAGELEARHVERFAELLALVHRRAWERKQELEPIFADRSFFESLRVEPYYVYTATQVPDAARFLGSLVEHTRGQRNTLVHGDYSPKNILVCPGRLVLLDHEVVHFGDGAFDLGFALTHLLSKAHHVVSRRDAFADAAARFWRKYREGLGKTEWNLGLEQAAVAHTLGCLLARVAGRSPLEYLDDAERARQRATVVSLMRIPPRSPDELIEGFVARIEGAKRV